MGLRTFTIPRGRSWLWPSLLASLAALSVRDEEAPKDAADRAADTRLLRALEAVEERLSRIEAALAERSSDTYAEAAADAVPAEDRAS